ncbi:MAG: OmpA family protein [Polyangiaceae bacterium]|nr:OmpA family protein [Polyangiaceae bacterium]
MRTRRGLVFLPVALLGTLVSANVWAQDAGTNSDVKQGEFTVQRFEPAPGSKNFLSVETARMEGQMGWTVGLMFNYAHKPFVVRSCISATDCNSPNAINKQDTNVISDMYWGDLMASISPITRLQVGLRVPVAYVNGDGINLETGGPVEGGLQKFGIGDINVEAKFRLLGEPKDPFVLALGGDISAPVGGYAFEGAYIGNQPVTGGLRLIFDGIVAERLTFGANLRGVLRQDAKLATTTIGPVDMRYGVGVGFQATPILKVMAEGYGSTQFSSSNGTNTLEVDGAVQVAPLDTGITITAGGGAGIIQGVGVPVARAIVGVMYAHEVGDQDADGLDDRKDQCPAIKEDFDKFEDDDGCPEDDNDGDKIPDASDKCPLQAENLNGLDDKDGCPDEGPDKDKDGIQDSEDKCPDEVGGDPKKVLRLQGPVYGCLDSDQDGVADKVDQCKDQPEDTDGFNDTDGCPDPDNDNDGIIDDADECIDQPEIKNGFKDEDGCPDSVPDKDGDGLPDNVDKCPSVPENVNGFEDDDGCPDKGRQLVEIGTDDIKILQRVEFATGKDTIQGAPSFAVLDAVASALKLHPEIFLVEIAGHTDNVGSAADNKALSQKRADAVMKYLVGKGIDAGRLQAKGYGPDKPVADNKTRAGQQKNRRVEFVILKSTKKTGVASVAQPGAPTPSPAPAPAPPK